MMKEKVNAQPVNGMAIQNLPSATQHLWRNQAAPRSNSLSLSLSLKNAEQPQNSSKLTPPEFLSKEASAPIFVVPDCHVCCGEELAIQ